METWTDMDINLGFRVYKKSLIFKITFLSRRFFFPKKKGFFPGYETKMRVSTKEHDTIVPCEITGQIPGQVVDRKKRFLPML